MSTNEPTTIQSQILDFMREFLVEEDRMPSTREIADHFGWVQTSALNHVQRIAAKGLLEYRSSADRKGGWWRFPRKGEGK